MGSLRRWMGMAGLMWVFLFVFSIRGSLQIEGITLRILVGCYLFMLAFYVSTGLCLHLLFDERKLKDD